ncbi:MAG: SpvB/TcaC N-terminal domain-containing protein, partial [Myxococcota bacterium]
SCDHAAEPALLTSSETIRDAAAIQGTYTMAAPPLAIPDPSSFVQEAPPIPDPVMAQPSGRSLTGQATVSSRGEARYSLPLWVPPGRQEMQPDLTLHYSSGAGLSVLGPGWSIASQQSIKRCSRTVGIDGEHEPLRLDGSDPLCLNGARLIQTAPGVFRRLDDDNSEVLAFGRGSNDFDYFVQRLPNGVLRTFGKNQTPTWEIDGIGYSWSLSREEDPHGNAVLYNTIRDSDRLRSIEYTTHPNKPGSRRIEFEYLVDSQTSRSNTYRANRLFHSDYRLDRIRVLVNHHVTETPTPVRVYMFEYRQRPDGVSHLTDVYPCNDDPPTDGAQGMHFSSGATSAGVTCMSGVELYYQSSSFALTQSVPMQPDGTVF